MAPPQRFPARHTFGDGGGRTPNPYQEAGGRTTNPYASGRTPAWSTDSRTPNPYATGKTPAWNASARTPNPHADGKTPAWNTSSRTPNPYAAASSGGSGGWGGATPKPAWDGATPARSGSGASSSWGGATPGRPSWGGQTPRADWGEGSSWVSYSSVLLAIPTHFPDSLGSINSTDTCMGRPNTGCWCSDSWKSVDELRCTDAKPHAIR